MTAAGLLSLTILYLCCLARRVEALNATATSWSTWGPYRPNLYFGVRPQVPDTLLMGLMWASGDSRSKMLSSLRDTCEQDDGMQGYGWTYYDTRLGGSQTIHDTQLQIDLDTGFIKSEDGKSWAVRITGTPKAGATNVKTSLIVHAAVEMDEFSLPKSLGCENQSLRGGGVEALCRGEIAELGHFEFQVVGDARNKALHDTAVNSVLKVSEDEIWKAKSVFTSQAKAVGGSQGQSVAVEDKPGAGNMHFIQTTFEGPFTLTLSYRTVEVAFLDPTAAESGLDSLQSAFPARADKVFPRAAPFEQDKYARFSQAIISNLLGGLGFFHGNTLVDDSQAPAYEETELNFWEDAATAMANATITQTVPLTLLSHTPSRPFFPRGFLWDEGFHLLPVLEWDLDLAISVLQSWFNLIDTDGWIGREQILGPEARSRVPPAFQVQYTHYANPPTLLLLLPPLLAKLTGASRYTGHPSTHLSTPASATALLRDLYPRVARHYAWFRRTQAGNFTSAYPRPAGAADGHGFRWRGRTPQHTLTSGLDDYPRANPPHPGELHLDALAWVGAAADALRQVAAFLGEEGDEVLYAGHVEAAKKGLEVVHWDGERYCDATVEGGQFARVCHEGYLSLFPLLLGLMDAEHPNLGKVLDLVGDEARLWSPFGLRSLSAQDENYGEGEDYWRGAVWVNLNVLAVRRLRELGLEPGKSSREPTAVQKRATALAAELRERVVNTVFASWEKTGFFWEQYKDKTGEGSHSRAFTGWTACVVLLLGLQFDKTTGERGDDATRSPQSSGPPSLTISIGLVVVVVAVVLLRRPLWVTVGKLVKLWDWRKGQASGRYEQLEVIDLDEGGHDRYD
ncbi:glycoside hydrolase family 63 protein [Lasiosphaeria hispida]|uniref:Mannosyl-oligosaccharide glucosidase n=1 Tax=Lasiosphaeria hispida TaxID=260671 RepID=A0AAJ0HP84_9PEZI|nr:glycoside hydrolase family 63 protein [Lasiosphaeria hispida]